MGFSQGEGEEGSSKPTDDGRRDIIILPPGWRDGDHDRIVKTATNPNQRGTIKDKICTSRHKPGTGIDKTRNKQGQNRDQQELSLIYP